MSHSCPTCGHKLRTCDCGAPLEKYQHKCDTCKSARDTARLELQAHRRADRHEKLMVKMEHADAYATKLAEYAERDEKMIAMCDQDATTKTITEAFGISRERVRQVLAKHGRIAKRSTLTNDRLAREAIERDAKYRARQGMSYAEYRALKARGVTDAYKQQLNTYKWLGSGWHFNLASWWAIWDASGKWEQRGQGLGKYVMARRDSSGPFSPSNVYITTQSEQSSATIKRTRAQGKLGRVLSIAEVA